MFACNRFTIYFGHSRPKNALNGFIRVSAPPPQQKANVCFVKALKYEAARGGFHGVLVTQKYRYSEIFKVVFVPI